MVSILSLATAVDIFTFYSYQPNPFQNDFTWYLDAMKLVKADASWETERWLSAHTKGTNFKITMSKSGPRIKSRSWQSQNFKANLLYHLAAETDSS